MSSFTSFVLSISTLLSFFAATSAVPSADNDPQKPALILVPAAFSKATVYDEVKSRLSGVGYDVVAINLPSVGKAAAYVDRTPDIKSLQKVLAQQLHQGKNVVLIGNSYGATVICDAVKDFEDKSSLKSTAPANGKILGLIFVSLFLKAEQSYTRRFVFWTSLCHSSNRLAHLQLCSQAKAVLTVYLVLWLHALHQRAFWWPPRHSQDLTFLVPLRRHQPRVLGRRHGEIPTSGHLVQPPWTDHSRCSR
jgi:pimeloyl-ACP methyl ester carboxylesterase